MCGFLGAIDFERGVDFIYPALQKGLKAICHRGPDGSREFRVGDGFLGHNRLSIIDLSSNADQPFKSVRAEAYLIYNGEIYNYKELKSGFRNIEFKTSSDTEILLEGYLSGGIEFFKLLRGIYSFAIFDNRAAPKVILGRDPSGIKPLYYFRKNGLYVFGSEIKAILPAAEKHLTINDDVIKAYLNLGYCPEPFTIYREINCVEPGSVLEFEKGKIKKSDLLKFNFVEKNPFSFEENVARTEEKIKKAVERNLISDVDVAVALSGGIDSSLIYACANQLDDKIRGLTVKFDDPEYDEEKTAKIFAKALGRNLQLIEVNAELNLDTLNKILLNFDQPYADSSAINIYYLTKAASKITKVLIGGDGGDELFNGYPSQTRLPFIHKFSSSKALKKGGEMLFRLAERASNSARRRSLKRFSDLWADKPDELLYDWHSWFPRKTLFRGESPFLFDTRCGLKLYNSTFSTEAPAEFKQRVVFDYFRKQMLGDYLRKTDMMAMLNGVEYRVPLLDEDLVEFALTIPFEQKSSLTETKKILRAIHQKTYPPHTSNAPKKGFTIPLDTLLRKTEFLFVKENLLKNGNATHQYVKKDYIEFLFKGLEDSRNVQADISRAGIYQRILMLYSLSLWTAGK